jgi:hypothetical protein
MENLTKLFDEFISSKKEYIVFELRSEEEVRDVWMHLFPDEQDENFDFKILYKAILEYKCDECDTYQKINSKNEYEEVCNEFGYNVETSPLLHYSDSYFNCMKCKEQNFIVNDYEWIYDQLYENTEKIRICGWERTTTLYIIKKDYDIDEQIYYTQKLVDYL